MGACAVGLAGLAVVWAWVLPQTPVRMARASAGLIGHLELWRSVVGWHLPVPHGRVEVACVVLATTGAAFGLYGSALWCCWRREPSRRALAAVTGAAIAFSTITVIALPTLNTDVYSYIATGRVAAAHGANPYAVASRRYAQDPVLRYADRKYTAIPGDNKLAVWTLLSSALATVTERQVVTSLLTYRIVLAAFGALSLLLIAAVLRRVEPRAQLAGVVAYGWNPIVIVGAPTKADALMVALLLAGALAFVTAHARAGIVAVALSALVKLISLPMLAVHWLGLARGRRWVELAVGSALIAMTVALVYAPFAGAPDLIGRELGLLRSGGSSPARTLVAVAVAAVVLWQGWRQDGTPRRLLRGWAIVGLASVATLPTLSFSWYLLVPLAAAVISASGPLIATAAAVSAASFTVDVWQGASRGPFPLAGVAATLLPWAAGIALAAGASVILVARRRRAAIPA
jgi:hypothetical protein